MNAHQSIVRLAIATALLTCLASAPARMDEPLAIVLVQAQTEPGGNDSVWIDVGFPITTSPDGRRDAMGAVRLQLADGETIVYRGVGGSATLDGQTLAGVTVELERVDGGVQTGETATLVVRPDPDVPECLIYDLLGANVHASGEAMGRFVIHFIAQPAR